MLRTHDLGTLGEGNMGQTVTVAGWVARRRDHGGVVFADLRDSTGIAQVVFREEHDVDHLRAESVVRVVGTVAARPSGNENPLLPSGSIEVLAETVEVLNDTEPLPFQLDDHTEVGEETRLKYRYLDLRRPIMAERLRLRSEAGRVGREVLHSEGYLEVETPTMTRSTPGGARDFLVPARTAAGQWYGLTQSPQFFKQLLQVGGVEKYYQFARCYRDEDLRADRQPEFTQLDIEASFVEQDDLLGLAERLVMAVWKLRDVEVAAPFPRLSYADAMARYGSDKPDTRFDLELCDVTEYFAETTFRVFQAPYVGAVVMPGGADQPRRTLDAWQDWARQRGAKGLAYVLIQADGTLAGPVAKNLSSRETEGLAQAVGAQPGDCLFFAAGHRRESQELLGAARCEIARRQGLIDPSNFSFLWVVDFPMFERADEAQGEASPWTAVHHAFTAPVPEHIESFDSDPASALARGYDLVCNGNEIAGGSIRIHRREIQERVFGVLGLGRQEQDENFGFLLEGLGYGAPPHGGIAFGWDRVVALLTQAESIREVIAFPKTGGFDPLTGAPAAITAQQRREAGVDAPREEKSST